MSDTGSSTSAQQPRLELKGITKSYPGVLANDHIDLKILPGEIHALLGENGAGKSTLVKIIYGALKADSGTISWNGERIDISNPHAARKLGIGMIFQHFNLLQTKTVSENIEMPLKLLGHSKVEREKRLAELLDFIDLKHKKDAYPDELSGGQKQRVGIARALANHPKILLCDEATSALDPQTTKSVLALLKKINQEQNITIVMVTHEMDVIESVCDYVAVMESGHVIETGSTLDIFSQPQHPTTKTFIQTVLQQQLPVNILNNLEHKHHKSIYNLQFLGTSAQETVIQAVIKQFDLSLNILFANMTEINGTVIGQMFIQLLGDPNIIQEAIKFLEQQGVKVEQSGVSQ